MHSHAHRTAGVLLHPSSLPGPQEVGCFGADAYRFLDFLAASGFGLWQILPLGPVDQTGSPYNSSSAFAGDPRLISHQEMQALEITPPVELSPDPYRSRMPLMGAFDHFKRVPGHAFQQNIDEFRRQQAHWIEDYALFCTIKIAQEGQPWCEWPLGLKERNAHALDTFRQENQFMVEYFYFEQAVFYAQWKKLKDYAHQKKIKIIGDIPIFVAWDSADVWAHREIFLLDENGYPTHVAGVPPDYFSAEGQRWGNPLYNWEHLQNTGFEWWITRLKQGLTLFDLLRIDHFRGFCACWQIPGDAPTAKQGHWVNVPGHAFFQTLKQKLGVLNIIAEDLGIITEDVTVLRKEYHLPGMSVLQFAFDGSPDNPYLPYNLERNTVVYTGTHDNDTTAGWFNHLSGEEKERVLEYFGNSKDPMPWPLIRGAISSIADMAILPMQDILSLNSEHRMNTPGTESGNWRWRFEWEQVDDDLPKRLHKMMQRFGRTRIA